MSSRDKKKWISKSYFNILEKIGYTTKSSSSDDTISQLIVAFCLFAVLSILFIVLTRLSITLDSKDESIETMLNILTSPIAQLTGIVLSFDMIKEVISKEVKALERQLPNREYVDALERSIKELENSNDIKLREEQELLYLAHLFVADEEIFKRMDIKSFASEAYREKFKTLLDASCYLQKRFADEQSKRKLRAVITSIENDSWRALATAAATVAFDLQNNYTDEINAQLFAKPNNFLVADIYMYLSAWLVSSIDNNIATAIPFMPIEEIGLRYLTLEQLPDIDKYEQAFDFLIKVFKNGKFCNFLKVGDGTKKIQELDTEEIKICEEVSSYLEELLIRLKNFELSQRNSVSNT